ncbi:ketopantoate reductase [Enhydrobacter aerosaccus]|uniref:2-dehydropantoate 2-reductase n=1 Tax=Enhydrobacter aerosaccus TaxID=225324 RepID=A0A1T4NB23_9HYPH|nr:ketopantoate reductase family protein [Enhydrobacter aerosaccus]SJZ76462.1 ketopantoate reductase [Enhydrobacter aerosaccus]
MRILVVGAGAIGGHFGGRWLAAGRDATFLVRERRAAQLAKTGLVVKSKLGDISMAAPPTVSSEGLKGQPPYDLVLLSCKAFDLDAALDAIAPAIGPATAILPFLNGIGHLDVLSKRFTAANVLGGQVAISLTLDPQGRILHLNDTLALSFGELDGSTSPRATAIAKEFAAAGVAATLSATILQDMWEKWIFIATAAGITCLMRATVGDIVAGGGAPITGALLDEIAAIATANGFAPRPAALQRARTVLTASGSPFTASMLRDVEAGLPVEVDHVIGDLLMRGKGGNYPVLAIAHAHLKAYEARRKRLAK